MGAPPMPRGIDSTLGRASGPSVDGIMPRLQRIGTTSPPPKAVGMAPKKIRKTWTVPTGSGSGNLTILMSAGLGGSSSALYDITVSAVAGGEVTGGTLDVKVSAVAGPNGNAYTEPLVSGSVPPNTRASASCIGGPTTGVEASVYCTDVSGLTITLTMDAVRR